MYQWELDGPAQQEFADLPPGARAFLAVFMDAVVIVDPVQYVSPGRGDRPGPIAVLGCFAPDGPQHCSGLPVARYSPAQLAYPVGAKWLLISQDREEHLTPAGTVQPFTWIALRRQS